MAKQCAYCRQTRPLTREHIWPQWLLDRTDYHRAYSARAGRIVGRDQAIRDVCAECNNVHLGRLDDYARGLYDSYFQHWVAEGEIVELRYDYGLLLRWLLKVAYNSARSTGRDAQLLARYSDVLVAAHPCTPTFALAFVETIMPAHVLDPGATRFRPVQPRGARCGPLLVPALLPDPRWALRHIQINSYAFRLILIDDTSIEVPAIAAVVDHLQAAALTPAGVTRIPAPRLNALQAMAGVETWPGSDRTQLPAARR